MRNSLFILLSFLFFAMPAAASSHTSDTVDMVKANLANKSAVLIDVREVSEWNAGHLQDASNVPLSDLSAGRSFDRISKDKIVYLHCQSGRRVIPALEALNKAGYSNIRALPWGYPELVKNGFEVAK